MPRRQATPVPPNDLGPTLSAIPLREEPQGGTIGLLSRRQRLRLAEIATRIRVPARFVLYREGTPAQSIYFNAGGVVKVFRDLPSGKRWITAFLFPDDMFGMAQNGLYVRTAQVISQATLYRIKTDDLSELLRQDAELQYQFLCKVVHELREAQRQTIVVGRKDAVGRVVMFIRQLERHAMKAQSGSPVEVEIPMTRSDIANYLGLSLEAVSRATGSLERDGIVQFIGRHRLRVLDRKAFDRLALMF